MVKLVFVNGPRPDLLFLRLDVVGDNADAVEGCLVPDLPVAYLKITIQQMHRNR